MTARHPLDGNAIAADRHYGEDFSPHDCAHCGGWFGTKVWRSRAYRDLCTQCENTMEDEP